MALRLAGEPNLVIQGADSQGWIRQITAQDALPGLKVDQKGGGRVFDFEDGGVSKMYLPDGGNVTIATSLDVNTVAPATGALTLNPAGQIECSNKEMRGVGAYRSTAGSDLWLLGNHDNQEAAAKKVRILTLDPVADAAVVVAEAEPTATPTTPFWAQRADVTVPIASALTASFLTLRWDPATDQVLVYVNDGGTIRSAVIGTVV